MHLFFTNLHRRHSIRTNEIFKIHNTLCNPLTHIVKLKSFSIRLKSLLSLEANIKSQRQKIFQPPLPVSPFFFLLQKNYLPFFHLTPSNIQSLHPSIRKFTSINFYLGGKPFRSSSNSNSLLLALPKK